jgi:hypothetical protein
MGRWGGFGDAWRQKSGFYLDPLTVVHQADPAHSQPFPDPNPVWQDPGVPETTPEYVYDGDMLSGDDWVADGLGVVLDTTPEDHNAGNEANVTAFGPETTSANAATAGTSYGAEKQDGYAPPLLQDFTTQQVMPRFEGLDSPAKQLNPVIFVRGLNSDPANNPEGFRRGWVEQTFIDRKLQVPAWNGRDHDRRLLTANTAFSNDQEIPPVKGTSGQPFGSLDRALKSISQTPMMRRQPETISESVTTDGSEQGYDTIPSDWVE